MVEADRYAEEAGATRFYRDGNLVSQYARASVLSVNESYVPPDGNLFGGNVDYAQEPAVACVLDMCRRTKPPFTLMEIVARIQQERPEMIVEFASIWGKLIHARLVQVCAGPTGLYEVAPNRSW